MKRIKRNVRPITAADVKQDLDDSEMEFEDEEATKKPKAVKKRAGAKNTKTTTNNASGESNGNTKPEPPMKKKHHGVTIGVSPYPNHARPTPEECLEVCDRLEKVHGVQSVPTKAPPPSLTRAGCGNVPSVVDAMIRTKLSAATTNANADRALEGMKTLGLVPKGRLLGEGSVDYAKVRAVSREELEDAIRSGGLAKMKSKEIHAILEKAWEVTTDRKKRLDAGESEFADMTDAEKALITAAVDQGMPCLDHFNSLSDQAALDAMTQYPGIGVKTAACVMCFCMSRPIFAVDTHVFRMCRWLGWLPEPGQKGQRAVDEITTFAHCDARIPNELKYKLHQLFIKHGQTCVRCNAHVTTEKTVGWDDGCVLEDLLKRVKRGDVKLSGKLADVKQESGKGDSVEQAAKAVAIDTKETLRAAKDEKGSL